MRFFWKLLTVLGVNGVMLWGLGFDGWTGPTALAVYWVENLISSVLIAVRIALHRWFTGKRGHFRAQLGVKVTTGEADGQKERECRSFLVEFLTGSLVFTAGHAIFLAILLYGLFKSSPDADALWVGVAGVGAFQFAGFVADVFGLKERPFAWIKFVAQAGLGRVAFIHIAIIAGMVAVAATKRDNAFFLPFAGLKLLVEFGSVFGSERRIERAPAWLVWLMNRLKPGGDFAAELATENERERAREAEDEEVVR